MTDAQALSRWIASEIVRLNEVPSAHRVNRFVAAISHISTRDAIMLYAISLIHGVELPDLDKIKDGT